MRPPAGGQCSSFVLDTPNGDYPGLDRSLGAWQYPSTVGGNVMARSKQPKPVHQLTVSQFESMFGTEEDCRAYLIARRWPNGVRCPRCANTKVYALASGHHWQCESCA